jgi:anti-sigma regulatory factor (Ser/Thr protein kinase)
VANDSTIRFSVPADTRYLPMVRAIVREASVLAGFPEDITGGILLAVTEAFTNVIRHAYGGDSGKPIDLGLRVQADHFRMDLVDYGRFVDPARIASRPLDEVRPGGLGVHIIKSTMDRVEYRPNEHGGTTLTLEKHAPAAKESS